MPNKDRPLVDRHAPKNAVGWLVNIQEQKVSRFKNDIPAQHATSIFVHKVCLQYRRLPRCTVMLLVAQCLMFDARCPLLVARVCCMMVARKWGGLLAGRAELASGPKRALPDAPAWPPRAAVVVGAAAP